MYIVHKSGRQDSNLRPPGPKPGALPSWATSRSEGLVYLRWVEPLPCFAHEHDNGSSFMSFFKWRYEFSWFLSSKFEGRKTSYDSKLTPRFACNFIVYLYRIWPPEFYDVIGILVVFILVTRFALASLPWTEATVNSVLYGFGRAWQLTRYLVKALARCVCCVPPHKSPSRKPK